MSTKAYKEFIKTLNNLLNTDKKNLSETVFPTPKQKNWIKDKAYCEETTDILASIFINYDLENAVQFIQNYNDKMNWKSSITNSIEMLMGVCFAAQEILNIYIIDTSIQTQLKRNIEDAIKTCYNISIDWSTFMKKCKGIIRIIHNIKDNEIFDATDIMYNINAAKKTTIDEISEGLSRTADEIQKTLWPRSIR